HDRGVLRAELEDVADLDPPGQVERLAAARAGVSGAGLREASPFRRARVSLQGEPDDVIVAPARAGDGVDGAPHRLVGDHPQARRETVGADVTHRRARGLLDLLLRGEGPM